MGDPEVTVGVSNAVGSFTFEDCYLHIFPTDSTDVTIQYNTDKTFSRYLSRVDSAKVILDKLLSSHLIQILTR